MSTPHKHASLIHALADGLAVEYRLIGGADWDAVRDFSLFDETGYEFRLKPKIIRFRLYLLVTDEISAVSVVHTNCFSAEVESCANFVRWLGDWQEVEA